MIAEPKLLAPEQVLDAFLIAWVIAWDINVDVDMAQPLRDRVWAFTSWEMHPIWGEQEVLWRFKLWGFKGHK